MKKRDGRLIYSPSDLIVFMESEFASYMDRFYLEFPDTLQPDPDDPATQIIQEQGNQHELDYLKALKEQGLDVCEIPRGKQAHEQTIEAMQAGCAIIYQGELCLDQFEGRSDFLLRVSGPSRLGDYHYQVWDTKLARKAKPYFMIQLCCYGEMLASIQGKLPEFMGIILGNNQETQFRTSDYFYYFRQLKERFLQKQGSFNDKQQPIPDGLDGHRRWTSLAQKILEERDHLCRVANIRKTQIRKLNKAGITTLTGLARTALPEISKMEPSTFKTLKQQAKLQLESKDLDKPKYEILPHTPNTRRGLGLLPPKSKRDVFFDMEGYPYIQDGLEYLFGASYFENSTLAFKDFWAHNRKAEKCAFEDFIDWVYARWQEDPGMHIYHYADYEVSAVRRLMSRHATREKQVDELLRAEVFVNLFTVVRQGLRVGTPSYSIKEIEHLYRPKRSTDVATAMDSVVFYQRWLEEQDGPDCTESKILQQIRDYNKDDCDSTAGLADWLRAEQLKAGITWVAPQPKDSESQAAVLRDETAAFARQLLSSLPDDPQKANLQTLLAQLLEFHWREAKPVFWAKYDRHDMTEQQLIDDPNCLGGLVRTAAPKQPPGGRSKSFIFEYTYNASQDVKMSEGSKCFFAHDLTRRTEIYRLDEDAGLVAIKMTPKYLEAGDPPEHLSLIPDEYVSADALAQSIYRTVSLWHSTGKLPECIEHFLTRRRPAIRGNTRGPIIDPTLEGYQLEQSIVDAVKDLNLSTLCIQGPPGSGKTTTGARIILALLKAGKRIGVSSNGHKAIANLLLEVEKAARADRFAFQGVKIQYDDEDFHLDGTSFQKRKKASEVFGGSQTTFQLIGGTAWAFSDESAVGGLDYLFVDEAGQVSVANLLAMAPSTQNIIVMGDQMQLSQPVKGSHPGESGKSVLQYLLQEHQTIPADFGIFLGITHRMHPDLCTFISNAVYEGRLHPSEETSKRSIKLPAGSMKYLKRSSGIFYVPVEHDSNTQGSEEEVEVIAEIVDELHRCKFIDNGQVEPIKPEHVLIVAPYNLQVRWLKSRINRDYVGTVDKFQGQQAPVVIVSMCASNANDSPRGIDFLFSKNRLNVAISRAKCLAIVVGSPELACTASSSVNNMELINLYCRIVEEGRAPEPILQA